MAEAKVVITSNPLEIRSQELGISLKQFTPEDAGAIFLLIDRSGGHLSQFGDETASKYPTEKAVLDSITNPKNPKKLRLGVWDAGTLVGSINLIPDAGGEQKAEIGYYLGGEFTKKGYMGRALRILVDYAFGELDYESLFGNVHPDNQKSQKVLLKAGFMQTGTLENGDFVYTINKK